MSRVRAATLDDLNEVANLWAAMVMEEFGEGATPDIPMWIYAFSNRMENNKNFTMLVAEDGDGMLMAQEGDGGIVGYISGEVYPEPSDGKVHGISQSIYVMPVHRKGKVGLNLYHNLARIFISQGAQVIEFLCKPDKIAFWEKKGYECTGTVMSMKARKLERAFGTGRW
jgi:GNAT superfamily N-acetyltransferase